MKTAKVSLNGAEASPDSEAESVRSRLCVKKLSGGFECQINGSVGVKKSDELELITQPSSNHWNITTVEELINEPYNLQYKEGSFSQISIDFNQPVLKTGEDEYRPFVYCKECFCAQGAADLAAAGCPILGNFTFTASANGVTFPMLQVDWMNGAEEPYIKYFSTNDPEWSAFSPYTGHPYDYSYPTSDSCAILYNGVGGGGFSGPEGILFGLNAGTCAIGPGGWYGYRSEIKLYDTSFSIVTSPALIEGTDPLKTIIPVTFSHPSTTYPCSSCTQSESVFFPTLEQLMQGVSFTPIAEQGYGCYSGPICDGDGNCQYVFREYTFTTASGGTLYFKIS
jgi:hypothetical protein